MKKNIPKLYYVIFSEFLIPINYKLTWKKWQSGQLLSKNLDYRKQIIWIFIRVVTVGRMQGMLIFFLFNK